MAAVEIIRHDKIKHGVGKSLKKNKSTMLHFPRCSFKFTTLFSLRAYSQLPNQNKEMEDEIQPVNLKEIFKKYLSEHDREH